MSSPDSWDDFLDAGERIIWQGRPDTALFCLPVDRTGMIAGAIFAAFAFLVFGLPSSTSDIFGIMSLLFILVGLYMALGKLVTSAFIRRHSWYTLTNRRALIATDLPVFGRRIKSYPITRDTVLDYRVGSPSSVFFASETRFRRLGGENSEYRPYNVPVGFERIAEADEVHNLMKHIQRGTE